MLNDGRTDLDALVGVEVFTSDGARLGKVGEVQDAAFKVDAPFKPDYWLPLNTMASVDEDRISLTFPEDQLGTYKRDEPMVA